MSELSKEAQRVISILQTIDDFNCKIRELNATDTRDWDMADHIERRREVFQSQKDALVDALSLEGIVIKYEYDENVIVVFKNGKKWLEYGKWLEF